MRRYRGNGKAAMFLAGLCVTALLLGGTSTVAQEQSAPKATAPAVNPAKEKSIRKLLDLTGAKKNEMAFGEQLAAYLKNMLNKNLPATEHKDDITKTLISKVNEHMISDEFISRLVPAYDQSFSLDELNGIIKFYETPVGRKLLESAPQISSEASRISDEWIKGMIPEILDELMEQYPELKQAAAPQSGDSHTMP